MMASPTLVSTWPAVDAETQTLRELSVRVEQKPLPPDARSVAAELTLDALPLRLEQRDDSTRCELTLDVAAAPLQCHVLQLQVASSARHVEVYIDGVRRNLLGEDERSDVYIGTFRATKAGDVFDVSEEFKATTRDHDGLKQLHRLRVKFVSLTGDKKALVLTKFRCLYVAEAAMPPPAPQDSSAMPSAAEVMGRMANLSLNANGGGPNPPLNPQMILLLVQQMMEREVDTKIARALDAKLSVLTQRVAFAEQMLLQVQEKTSAKHSQLEQKLATLQHDLGQLRKQNGEKTTDTTEPDAE